MILRHPSPDNTLLLTAPMAAFVLLAAAGLAQAAPPTNARDFNAQARRYRNSGGHRLSVMPPRRRSTPTPPPTPTRYTPPAPTSSPLDPGNLQDAMQMLQDRLKGQGMGNGPSIDPAALQKVQEMMQNLQGGSGGGGMFSGGGGFDLGSIQRLMQQAPQGLGGSTRAGGVDPVLMQQFMQKVSPNTGGSSTSPPTAGNGSGGGFSGFGGASNGSPSGNAGMPDPSMMIGMLRSVSGALKAAGVSNPALQDLGDSLPDLERLIQLQQKSSQEASATGRSSDATNRELEALSNKLRPRLQRMIQNFQQGLGQNMNFMDMQPGQSRPPRSPFGP